MLEKISLLSHTQASFAQLIRQHLGKGYDHATLIYEEWFRTGQITGSNPAFNNAKQLFQDILALIDLSIPSFIDKRDDGQTGKFLLQTHDGLEIESVLISMQAGGTLCISSQVGCRMGCAFCETGRMGLLRHLTTAEIISQVFIARFRLHFSMRNIVFMGMGEPFDNYEAVMQAVRILSDPHGFGFGRNHLTVSTSGKADGIWRLIEESEPIPNLAVSINAPTDELRQKLMPVNRKYPLSDLYKAMEAFCRHTGRQILIAYVLMKDENDQLEHADQLAVYLKGLSVKINVIPYNAQSHDRYQASSSETIDAFMQRLRQHGYSTLLRQTKGQKIMAACGQLGNLEFKKKRKNSSLPLLSS